MANRTHAQKNAQKKERTLFIDLPAKTQKTIGIIVAAVIVLLFACVVLKQYDLLPKFNGRLRYYNEELYGLEEGVLYTNKSNTTKAKVFAITEYTAPEGFVAEKERVTSTSKVSTACFGREVYRTEDTGDGLNYVTVKAVSKTPDKMLDSIMDYHTVNNEDGTTIVPEVFEGKTENGLKYKGIFSKTEYYADSNYYSRYAICYVEAKHGCSVLVMPGFKAATEEELPTEEHMMEVALTVMEGIDLR